MTLAQYLKNKREEQGETVEELATKNKINKDFLYAIENSDYSLFPAEVFRKGFLKIYARILNLDENYILALDRREYSGSDTVKLEANKLNLVKETKLSTNVSTNTKKQSIDLQQKFSKPTHFFTKDRLTKFLILVLFLIAGFFVKYQIDKANQLPELTLSSPVNVSIRTIGKENYTQNLATTNSKITLAGNIDPNDQLYIQSALSRWNSFGQFKFENYELKEGLNVIKIQAKNKLGKTSEIELDINYTPSVNPVFNNSSSSNFGN